MQRGCGERGCSKDGGNHDCYIEAAAESRECVCPGQLQERLPMLCPASPRRPTQNSDMSVNPVVGDRSGFLGK